MRGRPDDATSRRFVLLAISVDEDLATVTDFTETEPAGVRSGSSWLLSRSARRLRSS